MYSRPLHMPYWPWRRVIFDEIHDLVSKETESQKNLLQLSRTAKNVWLLSATPFLHGNMSVYASHELLEFCRLQMDVDHDLRPGHPFVVIKRKLNICSPKHVADSAVTASQKVTHATVQVEATALERRFFEREKNDIASHNIFSKGYDSLRQMMSLLKLPKSSVSKSTARTRTNAMARKGRPNLVKSSWYLALKIRQVQD